MRLVTAIAEFVIRTATKSALNKFKDVGKNIMVKESQRIINAYFDNEEYGKKQEINIDLRLPFKDNNNEFYQTRDDDYGSFDVHDRMCS